MVAYSAGRRIREIGIRVALGVNRPDVLKLLLGQGMLLTLTGVALGLAGALALTHLMSSLFIRSARHRPRDVRERLPPDGRRRDPRELHPRAPRDERGPGRGAAAGITDQAARLGLTRSRISWPEWSWAISRS